MTHKIGIVTKNLNFFNLLNKQRRSDQNYEMELVKSMDSFNQIQNMGKVISSFIFDSSHTTEDIIQFGKYIKNSKRHHGALIFLAFDNFEMFQAITVDDSFSNAKIINMPATASEIYLKLITDTAQIDSKVNQKSKTEGAITSPYFTGSFFISFPEETYLKMCSKILYEEVTKIDKDNEDLVSELCNIVYGKSKVLIAKLDMKMGMVIPTYNREPKVISKSSILVVKLDTDMGEFYVKVAPGLT